MTVLRGRTGGRDYGRQETGGGYHLAHPTPLKSSLSWPRPTKQAGTSTWSYIRTATAIGTATPLPASITTTAASPAPGSSSGRQPAGPVSACRFWAWSWVPIRESSGISESHRQSEQIRVVCFRRRESAPNWYPHHPVGGSQGNGGGYCQQKTPPGSRSQCYQDGEQAHQAEKAAKYGRPAQPMIAYGPQVELFGLGSGRAFIEAPDANKPVLRVPEHGLLAGSVVIAVGDQHGRRPFLRLCSKSPIFSISRRSIYKSPRGYYRHGVAVYRTATVQAVSSRLPEME